MAYEIINMNKDMKRLLCMLAFASLGLSVYAQIDSVRTTNSTLSELKKVNHSKYIPVFQYCLSQSGLSYDLAMSLCRILLRI